MKYRIVFTFIIVLSLLVITTVGRSDLTFDEEPVNRDMSKISFDINLYYIHLFATDKLKKENNRFSFSLQDRTGADSDGPLFTTASTCALIYTDGGEWVHFTHFAIETDHIPEKHIKWVEPSLRLPIGSYNIWEPNRKTESTAYAYASCSPMKANYKSKYEVFAQIDMEYSSDYTIRKRSQTRTGIWADSAYVEGSVDRFENPTQVYGEAESEAIGKDPTTGKEHKSKSVDPDVPSEYDIYCGLCNRYRTSSCSICSSLKTSYNVN